MWQHKNVPCRGSLRSASGQVPNPPFDIALARLEKRQFRDKNGDLRTPTSEQPSHYHQGRIREEGMQLTISPTCEQKLNSIYL